MTVVTEPRIRPGARAEVGTVNWVFAQLSGLVTGTTAPNVFLVLGRHRKLFRGWLRFAGRLMPGGTLPRRETELLILRVAHRSGCAYEFAHHSGLARRAGVSEAEIRRVIGDADDAAWSSRERVLFTVADELHDDRDVSDQTWAALRDHVDEPTAIEVVLLITHYEMLATTINTLRVPPDRPRRRD